MQFLKEKKFFQILSLLIIINLFPLIGLSKQKNEIVNLRAGVHPGDIYRIVLETSSRVEAKLVLRENPFRFEIILPESFWRVGVSPRQGSFKPKVPAKYSYRNSNPGSSNLIIQTDLPFSIENIFWLPPSRGGERLVLDFMLSSETEFEINQLALNNLSIESFKEVLENPPKIINTNVKLFDAVSKLDKKMSNDEVNNSNKFNTVKSKINDFVVVIDPGHGGKDPGAIGFSKTFEKDVNLIAAKLLKKKLNEYPGVKVFLTREEDKFIHLRERYKIAQKFKADIFISLHSDSIKSSKVKGYSVYTLDEEKASDIETADLVKSENNSALLAGIELEKEDFEVQDFLYASYQKGTLNFSVRLKNLILSELEGLPSISRGWKYGPFAVLKAPDIPSILIEMGFLSNKEDEAKLNDKKYLSDLTNRLAKGILKYKEMYINKKQ